MLRRANTPAGHASYSIVPLLIGVVVLAAGALFATLFHPKPISDWAAYWHEAMRPLDYIKGGPLGWFLWPLAHMGLPSYWTAFVMNGASVLLTLWALSPATETTRPQRWLTTLLLLAVAFWSVGLLPIVNSDLPAIACLAAALRLVYGGRAPLVTKWSSSRALLVGVLLTLATSFRSATLLAVVGAYAVTWSIAVVTTRLAPAPRGPVRGSVRASALILLGVASVLAATAIEASLRAASTERQRLQVHSRVTFYTGFVAQAGCGTWSAEALAMAVEDSSKPLRKALSERLAGRTPAEWARFARCKAILIVRYPLAFSANYLSWSADRTALVAPYPPATLTLQRRVLPVFHRIEAVLGSLVLLIGFVMVFLFTRRSWRERWWPGLFPFGLLVATYFIHFVLETQPRYYVPAWVGVWVVLLQQYWQPPPTADAN